MKTNGISNPIGYELGIPSLSWIIRNAPLNSKLISSRVEISEDESFNKILSDSGPKKDLSSIDYRVNFKLLPRKRYFWRVTAELTNITIKSPSAYFETSKLDEPWQSNWISPKNNKNPPLLRKQFTLKENHENARIYITGLGLYELYINGKRVSNELFTPFCNIYEKWIQYQTFDVSDFIQKGENVIGVIIGDGWAKGRWGFAGTPADMTLKSEERGFPREISTSKYLLNVEMHIKTEDNSEVVIVSDETWKTSKSEILFTNIYDGEVIDSNLIQEGWSNIDFDDSNWESVQIVHHESKNENSQNYNDNENNIIKNEEQKFVLGKLTARYSIPVIVKEEIKPKQIIKGENGDIIIDMGKNIVGWLQFSCNNLPKNFEIVLEFGEILQNNNFFRENLRNAQQQFRYVSNGKKSVNIHPHFTFYGFQYVRLTNWPTKSVNINDFLGLSIYSDFEQIGFVKTSDSLVNKLIDNILWSQKDNFLDVPTDCPQRDERMGWTGDAQSFSGTALFNSDCYAFYRKYAHDLALMQTFNDGMVPNVVPYFGPREKLIGGKCAWGDSACIIPWNVYLFTGKKQILEEQFESMKSWVDWIKNHGNQNQNHRSSNSQTKDLIQNDFTHENNYLWYGGDLQFGDWLALDGPTHPKVNIKRTKGGTDTTFLCSAFYYYSTSLLVKAAKVLGKSEVVEEYSKLSENILNSVRNEFFSKNGRCAVDTQTAYIISLQFGLVPKAQEKVIFSQLFKLLTKKEMHLTTGFIGTPFICRAISDAGFPKYAYDVFMQIDFPGWLNQVKMGANSLWERWNSLLPNGKVNGATMNSFNHYWSGSILEWIYRNVGGIIPIEDKPGFMEFNLWPQPGSKIEEIYIKYDSPMGTIKSGWKFIDNMNVRYHFTVPFNTIGHMKLENADASECKVINGTICLKQDEKNVVADLSNGKYIIQCPYVQKEFEPTAKFN